MMLKKTLLHLAFAANYAIEFTKNLGAVKRTSLIFRGYGEKSSFTTGDPDNNAATLLKVLNEKEFDFVRENKEFTKIMNDLSKYNGQWKTE